MREAPTKSVTVYAATIFLGAFLLFQVQPLIAKIILPWFGGSAALWSVTLLFFQLLLLGGYAYAYSVVRYLRGNAQMVVHVGLLTTSCALLPILPSPAWKPAGADDPTFRILMLLAVTIGLPYFLLSSTSPLLQAWYVRHSGSVAPYRLFALSNFGSMLGLVSFPFLIEPQLTSRQQAYAWSGAYVVFALLCAAAAWMSREGGARPSTVPADARASAGPPSLAERLLWVGLAACASTLLLAVTGHLSQNVAPIPLLWIVPLALYLATFILAFESDRVYHRRIFLPLLAAALGGMAYLTYADAGNIPIQWMIPAFSCGLFICCMVCHGELARRRPDARYLTLFYLLVALGGAVGGVFVALVAPRIFPSYIELPIGLVAVAFLATVMLWRAGLPGLGVGPLRFTLVAGTIVLAAYVGGQEYLIGHAPRLMARNFYGVLRVVDSADGVRILWHGTVPHGSQFLDAPRRHQATTYYGPNSGVGRALRALQSQGPIRVGVIGLGAGVLSTYSRAGDVYRFYEINPLVERIAQTEFTFYAHSPADTRILLGDARLVLERQDSQHFDLLAVDAFSGDAVPVHLLTREAMALYVRHLRPTGILALHVSNRYLDLVPVVARDAQSFGRQAIVVEDEGEEGTQTYSSTWVLLAPDVAWFRNPSFATAAMMKAAALPRIRTWTDDYSNIFQILRLDRRPPIVARADAPLWDIVPGQRIGLVRLDSNVRDVTAVLGPEASTGGLSDGSFVHRWFEPPMNVGLGMRATPAGTIYRIWVINSGSSMINGRLHVGSREAEVLAALGAPSRVTVDAAAGLKTLWYDARGLWVGIQLDARYTFYNAVFQIGVMHPM